MYKLAKILSEIRNESRVTPEMVKNLYESLLMDNDNFNIFHLDDIMLKHGLSDLYQHQLYQKIDQLDSVKLSALYKDLISFKKSLEK